VSDKPRIYADFNKMGADKGAEWVILTCRGTFEDLAKLGIQLEEGQEAIFYMDDADERGNSDELEADGKVHFDEQRNHWIAILEPNSFRHASDRRQP
jgi:hypothetical protein